MPSDSPTVAARRARLRSWIDSRYGGRQGDFQTATKLNQGYLSALLNGDKSFGEKAAANIERLAGMPEGYLVRSLLPVTDDASASQPLGFDIPSMRNAGKLLGYVLGILGEKPEQETNLEALNIAYVTVLEAGAKERDLNDAQMNELAPRLAARLRARGF